MAFCECGCGLDAGVYTSTNITNGTIKGQPKRFIRGHQLEYDRGTHCKNGHLKTPENNPIRGRCLICARIRGTKWRATHPVERLAIARKHMYGITDEQYQSMLTKQNHKCSICAVIFDSERKLTIPCIDHDHSCCPKKGKKTCGKCLRGVICYGCNIGLGAFKDNIQTLENAIKYLKEAQGCQIQTLIPPDLESKLYPASTFFE